jgi:hypothetical protein
VPNVGPWKELCPETRESAASVLLLSVSSGFESAMVFEYAENQPRLLHLTYDHFEVLELVENAFDIYENVGQTEFELCQKAYAEGIRALSSSNIASASIGGRI